MNMKKFTTQLADWIVEHPVINNKRAHELAYHGFLDTISCIISGKNNSATEIVRKTASRFGTGNCSVIGENIKLSSPNAALVNATSAHALDFDDNYRHAITHPSAVLVPALLALAEENNFGIKDVIDAYIVGLEIQARIGKFVNPQHYSAGWHSTSTVGVIGSAAACAHLLKLNKEQTLNCISISSSMASGTKKQFGTLTKPFHAGMASQNGIIAAYLAKNGLNACAEPITGVWGFIDLFTDENTDITEDIFDDELMIIKYGLSPKRFPCCGSIHKTLDGILELMEEHSLKTDSVKRIETTVPKINFNNLKYNEPVTEAEAKFSMHYCVAVILNTGKLSLSDFTLEAINERKEIRDSLKHIKMIEKDDCDNYSHDINIYLNNGAVIGTTVVNTKGLKELPFTTEERKSKFYDCVAEHLNSKDKDDLYNYLLNLEFLDSINNITKYFR